MDIKEFATAIKPRAKKITAYRITPEWEMSNPFILTRLADVEFWTGFRKPGERFLVEVIETYPEYDHPNRHI